MPHYKNDPRNGYQPTANIPPNPDPPEMPSVSDSIDHIEQENPFKKLSAESLQHLKNIYPYRLADTQRRLDDVDARFIIEIADIVLSNAEKQACVMKYKTNR